MSKINLHNTYKSGIARVIIYKSGSEYRAVCLDFDIVVAGNNQKKVVETIKNLVEGYVENASKNKLPEIVLNRPAAKKYWKKYQELLDHEKNDLGKVDIGIQTSKPITFFRAPYLNSSFQTI